ncbi:MAG: hypothetical protein WAN72_04205, partial [Candidatus Acidiferrales bacterium]
EAPAADERDRVGAGTRGIILGFIPHRCASAGWLRREHDVVGRVELAQVFVFPTHWIIQMDRTRGDSAYNQ